MPNERPRCACTVNVPGADPYGVSRTAPFAEAGRPRVWAHRPYDLLDAYAVAASRSIPYLTLFVVYQICGAPLTPDFSIAAFNSGNAANALAFSALWKSWITVTSFGSSAD